MDFYQDFEREQERTVSLVRKGIRESKIKPREPRVDTKQIFSRTGHSRRPLLRGETLVYDSAKESFLFWRFFTTFRRLLADERKITLLLEGVSERDPSLRISFCVSLDAGKGVAVYPSEPDPEWQGRVTFQVNSRRSESHSTLEMISSTIGFCKLTLCSTMDPHTPKSSRVQALDINILDKDKTRRESCVVFISIRIHTRHCPTFLE